MSNIAIPCPACGRELKIRDRSLLGKKGKCPRCQHTFVLEEPAAVQLAGTDRPTVGTTPGWTPDAASPAPFAPLNVGAPGVSLPIDHGSSVARIRQRKKQKRQRTVFAGVMISAIVIIGGVLGYVFMTAPKEQPGQRTVAAVSSSQATRSAAAPAEASIADITASPTQGGPIPLEMIPAGARLLLHLRPAELWQADGKGEELRYCLGPLGEFLDLQIKSLCKFPPDAIDEVLFAWVPGPRGTPPDFSYIVRLKGEAKKSELLDAFGGERDESFGRPIYVDKQSNRAAIIVDLKTFAIGPMSIAGEMVSAIGGKNPLPDGVEELFPKSDRNRHITVYFEPTAVELDEEFLAPANARSFLRNAMEWFGDSAEAVLWSLHLEDKRFYSEVLVRNQSGVRPIALEERLRDQLDQLPKELLAGMRSMQPTEVGKRQIIGRVPAMSKVVAMATVAEHGKRDVRLVTSLPDRAAPNLALGTLLAWDESTRTDFNKKPRAQPGSDSSKLPGTIAERLKKKIDVDFRRTPLQDAFAFIGDETKVTFEIDGDALKLSGFTKNMTKSTNELKLDQTPATTVLAKIIEPYDPMCLVVDEQKKIVQVTTKPVADQKGLKPFPLP